MHIFAIAATSLVALIYASGGPVSAATPPWPDRPLSYAVVDQDLHDLLIDVGGKLGLRVSISDAVRGRVHGRLPPAAPREFLDQLASIYDFDWYFDGGTLFISSASEVGSKLLNLGPVPPATLIATLDELGIADQRWPIRSSHDAGIALVSGPPRYTALVEQTLEALHKAPLAGVTVTTVNGDVTYVQVFRGLVPRRAG
jgi:type III secretion protein C